MPNTSYQITLTSEQANSGPYYVVTYTTGAYYQPVLVGSPAYLPNVGDTAVVQIPQAASSASYLAFKLDSGTACEICNKEVILIYTGSAPTVACCIGSILTIQAKCQRYFIENPSALTRSLNYTDCNNATQSLSIPGSTNVTLCLYSYEFNSELTFTPTGSCTESGSLVTVTYNSGTGTNCLNCSFITVQTSSDGFGWGGDKTGSCGTSQSIDFTAPTSSCPANTIYYRAYQTCTSDSGNVTSSYFITSSFTSTTSSICCTPSITSIEPSGSLTSSLFINFATGSTGCCLACSYMTLVTSSDGATFGGAVTASCTASQFITPAPAEGNTFYFKVQQTCSGSVTSSFSGVEGYYNSGGGGGQTIFTFGDSGKGQTIGGACSDYPNSTLYSNCDSLSFGTGCTVYTDAGGTTPLTGFPYIFMNFANWDVNTITGVVTGPSSQQC